MYFISLGGNSLLPRIVANHVLVAVFVVHVLHFSFRIYSFVHPMISMLLRLTRTKKKKSMMEIFSIDMILTRPDRGESCATGEDDLFRELLP